MTTQSNNAQSNRQTYTPAHRTHQPRQPAQSKQCNQRQPSSKPAYPNRRKDSCKSPDPVQPFQKPHNPQPAYAKHKKPMRKIRQLATRANKPKPNRAKHSPASQTQKQHTPIQNPPAPTAGKIHEKKPLPASDKSTATQPKTRLCQQHRIRLSINISYISYLCNRLQRPCEFQT